MVTDSSIARIADKNLPSGSQYTIDDYRVFLIIEEKSRILVEGHTDKQVFELLLDELSEKLNKSINNIIIETSDLIENKSLKVEPSSHLGCREKVEIICEILKDDINHHKIFGFVDREFRGFDLSEFCVDKIGAHKVVDRVIWTRGHSIENYFFDRKILRKTLKIKLTESWFKEALKLFERYFESVIRIACCVSIVAKKTKKLQKVENSIDRILIIDKNNIDLNYTQLKTKLIQAHKVSDFEADSFIEELKVLIQKSGFIDFEVGRWLCHGHIGFKFILALFYLVISEIRPGERPQKYLGNCKEKEFLNICSSFWIQFILEKNCEHPLDDLKKLGIDLI
jgi:hypothetical protein